MPSRPRSVRETLVTVTGPSGLLAPSQSAAQRRVRTLAVLGSLLVVWVVLVLLHKAPRLSLVIPVGLVVGFLVIARRQAALSAEIRRRQAHREALTDAARAAETRYDSSRQLARRGGRAVDAQPVRREAPVAAPEPVYIAPAADGTPGFAELVSLAARIRATLGKASPLAPQHVQGPDSSPVTGLNSAELDGRIAALEASFSNAVDVLARAAKALDEAAGAAAPRGRPAFQASAFSAKCPAAPGGRST